MIQVNQLDKEIPSPNKNFRTKLPDMSGTSESFFPKDLQPVMEATLTEGGRSRNVAMNSTHTGFKAKTTEKSS